VTPQRSAAAVHADWLSLVEPHGQFLTLPVLRRVLPDGLPRADEPARLDTRELARTLTDTEAARTTWLEFLLRDLLGWGPYLKAGPEVPDQLSHTVAEHRVTLRPEYALLDPATGAARVLVERYPLGTRLDQRLPGEAWAASPIERTALLCRATGVPVGVVSDTRFLVLVWAPVGQTGGHATWDTTLFAEGAEARLVDALAAVLGARRLFAAATGDRLEDLLRESGDAQEELTRTLGRQVRQAVELLVAALSRADLDARGALLGDVAPHTVYQASCTVLMRLVFLLYAEERGLLPLGDPLYDEHYAASTLREQLVEVSDLAGDEPLELRSSAWHRVLATSRAVHAGIAHDRLRLPAYGGGLFDPDRFPFLEGRRTGEPWPTSPARPIPVDDLTLREILTAVQTITTRAGGVTENRRLSFRALDVEQIGFVYEGLLDHSAVRAQTPVLGLVGRTGIEPEIRLPDLDEQAAAGRDRLVAFLAEQTGRTPRQVTALLDGPLDADARRRLLAACDNDAALVERVTPFAGLLRDDLRGLPMVVPEGALYVTEVSTRRDTGTEYTPRVLADEVVQYALEPLVYRPGPAEGADPADWVLRPADEILSLTVCDPAVGSGAILVAACRYLADRLVEAWQREGNLPDGYAPPPPGATGEDDELTVLARRAVADRCLFAVDRDPMAVEMAKLSLWLTTLAKDRPFTFVDHALQCGDSLLGVTSLDQVTAFHLDPDKGRRLHADLFGDLAAAIKPVVDEAIEKRRTLESLPVRDVHDAERKAALDGEASALLGEARTIADLVVGAALRSAGKDTLMDQLLVGAAPRLRDALDTTDADERRARFADLAATADAWLNHGRPDRAPMRRCLHWPLAFPEVLAEGRFDTMVGNPPFMGGQKLTGNLGVDLREHCVRWLADGTRGSADLVAYFFIRAAAVADGFGLLATNTIGQGDTREVALDRLTKEGWTIHRAVKSEPWPGSATLEIAKVWSTQRRCHGLATLDANPVRAITSSLDPGGRVTGNPYRLAAAAGQSFQGSIIGGQGFSMSHDEALALIDQDPRSADVLFPYLNGEDVNSSPTQAASRWVINFFDWPEDRARRYAACYSRALGVREFRHRKKPDGSWAVRQPRRSRWWQYAERAPALYTAIKGLDRVLVIAQVSRTIQPARVQANQVLAMMLVVFPYSDAAHLALLSSSLHSCWVLRYGSTMRTDLRYTPSDVFETFAQPPLGPDLDALGDELEAARKAIMLPRQIGLTKTYNLVHDPRVSEAEVEALRDVHRRIDVAVRDAYGWSDLELGHGFHETSQGVRWTISPAAQVEVLDRLLELNHQRYAEEVGQGLHAKAARKAASRRRQASRPAPAADTLELGL
jgi:hypothetical protein